jgi:Na+-transporting NADH:ubiquinone oxidoreductase subunit NqrC
VSFNPHLTDLDQYTDSQLEARITDLQRKYFQTHNLQIQNQIIVVLEMHKEELRNRQMIAAQRQREQNGDSGLDDLINVS